MVADAGTETADSNDAQMNSFFTSSLLGEHDLAGQIPGDQYNPNLRLPKWRDPRDQGIGPVATRASFALACSPKIPRVSPHS